MISTLSDNGLQALSNRTLRAYARLYSDIDRDFRSQVESFGLPFSQSEAERPIALAAQRLAERGVEVSNDCRSLHTGWISPSCVQCRKGLGTATFLLSVQCPRHCYFCFNPNQIDYERLLTETNDVVSQINEYHDQGVRLSDIALTGGEPLLHPDKTVSFFEHALTLYPEAYTRLYTSGTHLDETLLERLADARLNEIRLSIKLDEGEKARRAILALVDLSKAYIEHVVVEMPVMPDAVDDMKRLLRQLDDIGISGINLLELCYPLYNAEEFSRRGYKIKKTPYRVLYDYWYAGGLPIAGSEDACLELLEFSLGERLRLGVHYCSLENKFSSQVYLQNKPYEQAFPRRTLSDRDHFLKSAKAFGGDAEAVRALFEEAGESHFEFEGEGPVIEFEPSLIPMLAACFPAMEIAISYGIVERSEGNVSLRELKLDLTTPASFDIETDV